MKEQALKERLKFIAISEQRSFQEVWKLLALERLLARLSYSSYHDKFIFKGGLLLSHYLIIGRETTDIDFLTKKMQAKMPSIEKAFIEICHVMVADGFVMSFANIDTLDHVHMNYPGYRLGINVKFGKMKDRIQVDIGVGDSVEAKQLSWELFQYKGKPIFEGAISLQVYPVETIFAEKLETIVSRGAANSRMKDFHDILLMCRERNLINADKLIADIEKTFLYRKTEKTLPLKFKSDDYARLQPLWARHLRTLGDVEKKLGLPHNISELVREINRFLAKVISMVTAIA